MHSILQVNLGKVKNKLYAGLIASLTLFFCLSPHWLSQDSVGGATEWHMINGEESGAGHGIHVMPARIITSQLDDVRSRNASGIARVNLKLLRSLFSAYGLDLKSYNDISTNRNNRYNQDNDKILISNDNDKYKATENINDEVQRPNSKNRISRGYRSNNGVDDIVKINVDNNRNNSLNSNGENNVDNFNNEYQLNVQLSHSLPLDRPVPDTRHRHCLALTNGYLDRLPSVTVIIPFHNEPWSTVLRTVHSVLARTSPVLLREVLLVDDASDLVELGKPMEKYLGYLEAQWRGARRKGWLRVIRVEKREGLIRARMRAARVAVGEVLIFLDSHLEVNVGWLEPLLQIIRDDPRTLVVPQTDTITADTLEYRGWEFEAQGGFTWDMQFLWKFLPPDVQKGRKANRSVPYMTPVIVGCAIAISRRFFFELGGFDEGMMIWGGENLELSLKVWLCGGSVYIAPCSRIGHVFRRWLPYAFPSSLGSGRTVKLKNYQRLAEVWLGNYTRYFYATVGGRVAFNAEEENSLAERRAIRDKLSCRPFSWYLNEIQPELAVPMEKAVYSGNLMTVHSRNCLRVVPLNDTSRYEFIPLMDCSYHDHTMAFSMMPDGRIVQIWNENWSPRMKRASVEGRAGSGSEKLNRRGQLCLTAQGEGFASLQKCPDHYPSSTPGQNWIFDQNIKDWLISSTDPTVDLEYIKGLRIKGTHIGKLKTVNKKGKLVCLTQVTVPWDTKNKQQIAGLLPCYHKNNPTDLYQYWHFTYTLDWTV